MIEHVLINSSLANFFDLYDATQNLVGHILCTKIGICIGFTTGIWDMTRTRQLLKDRGFTR